MRTVLLFLDLTSTGTQLVLLAIGLAIVFQSRLRRFLRSWREFRAWQAAGMPVAATQTRHAVAPAPSATVEQAPDGDPIGIPTVVDYTTIPLATVPGAARALMAPPSSLWYSIDYIQRYGTAGRFTFPLGWYLDKANEPDLFVGHLVNDVNCGLLTAVQGGGKDNELLNMLFALMALNSPERLQIVIVDGKGGLDYIGWQEKAHVWHLAQEAHELPEVMDLLTAERMRRIRTIRQAGVSKWENYKGTDMPMLVVVFSEIKMLQRVMRRKDIEEYLDSELSVWRGLGMRMFVCTQNSSNWSKEWRAAFEFYIAGTQPSRDEDKPNTGRDTSVLEGMGVVPPSKLPSVGQAPGVMTVVHGNAGVTVRTSFIDDDQRAYWLRYLPQRTPEGAQQLVRQKAALLRDLQLFRATIEAPSLGSKPAPAKAVDQPAAPSATDWRDWAFASESENGTEVEQPVIALAQAEPPAAAAYDRQELAGVLASIKLKDLPAHPTFVAACRIAYQKRGSYMGVAKEFWGSSTGSRETVIKAALGHAEVPRSELAPAA